VIPFAQLSIDDTVAILMRQNIDQEDARLLARLAEGSPGKALLFQKTEMIALWRKLVSFLSDPAVDPDRDVGDLLHLAEKMASLKEELPSLLGLLKIWIRDLLLGDIRDSAVKQDGSKPVKDWNSGELFVKIEAVGRAQEELSRNCNRNLVCEVLLFKLQ
jgi:DNA polymerase-3 subunit delta'